MKLALAGGLVGSVDVRQSESSSSLRGNADRRAQRGKLKVNTMVLRRSVTLLLSVVDSGKKTFRLTCIFCVYNLS